MVNLAPNAVFTVDETPFCLWDWRLGHKNLEFLDQIDADYYRFQAEAFGELLESANGKRAAISLRIAYHHGLETLFSLLCATAQAPHAVIGWLLRCRPGDLRAVVGKIQRQENLTNLFTSDSISWSTLSEIINNFGGLGAERQDELRRDFASLWQRFAADLLSEDNRIEYNAMKHGMRVSQGGFSLWVGLEPSFGVAPPPEEMKPVGSSKYGTSVFVAERIEDSKRGSSPHFRLNRKSYNWLAESTVVALQLLSMSIQNIVGYLRVQNGAPPTSVKMTWPSDSDAFSLPWQKVPGVLTFSMNETVAEEHVVLLSRKDLKRRLDEARTKRRSGRPTDR